MNSSISQRFIACYEQLLERGTCRSARQFASLIGIAPQAFNEILKYRREVNIEIIEKTIRQFQINANYLFSGEGPKFLKEEYTKNLSILTIVSNEQEQERIVHVPIQAQAGYVGRNIDPVFIQSLPSYTIPFQKMKTDGTMRSYEVDGDSMEPLLVKGDIIIAAYLHAVIWEKNIKDSALYVVITQQDVLVKRITNRLREERKLILHSDNDAYPSFAIKIEEIKEIWQVKARVTLQLDKMKSPKPELEEELDHLKQMISNQSSILENLVERLDS